MMRDLFARWAPECVTSPESRAARATRATPDTITSDSRSLLNEGPVAPVLSVRATRATRMPEPWEAVAHVAQRGDRGATAARCEKSSQDYGFSGSLPSLPVLPPDLTAGEISAVRIDSRLFGESIWLVRDADALAENPDIEESGLPVLFFDEVEHLRSHDAEQIKVICTVKRVFPTSRILH